MKSKSNDSIRQTVDALAQSVHRLWQAHDMAPEALPAVARQAFEAADLQDTLTPNELLQSVLGSRPLPSSSEDSTLGNALVLHRDEHVEISAHLWIDELDLPRRENRWGALQIVTGSSLLGRLVFEEHKSLGPGLRLGQVHLDSFDLLGPDLGGGPQGNPVVEIEPGPDKVLSLCSIDAPSMAIAIRSRKTSGDAFELIRPGLAVAVSPSPGEAAGPIQERLRAWTLLGEVAPAAQNQWFVRLCCGEDLETAYCTLRHAQELGYEIPDKLAAEAVAAHGEDLEHVLRSLDGLRRHKMIHATRADNDDPDLRFFLAALFLAETREQVDTLLDAAYGEPASEEEARARLGRLLGPVLVEGDDLPDGLATALGRLVDGLPMESAIDAVDVEADEREDLGDFLSQVAEAMTGSSIFDPLFTA